MNSLQRAVEAKRWPAYLLVRGDHLYLMSSVLEDAPLWDYEPTGNRPLDDTELKHAAGFTTCPYSVLRESADRILKGKEQT